MKKKEFEQGGKNSFVKVTSQDDGENRIYYFPRIEFYFLALGKKYPYINYSNKLAALPISIAVGNMFDYKRLFENK